MNLDAKINALRSEMYRRGTIPCALLGRKVRETECCSRGLAANVEDFQTCRACPEGQRLAASAPLWGRYLPPVAPAPAKPAPVILAPAPVAPVARPKRKYTRRAVPAPAVEQLAPAQVAPPEPGPLLPNCPCIDPRLAKLAEALRNLTADGRMRVSMLDVMRAVGAANYDATAALVLAAGLRTSRLSGPVESVLVDHNMRQLLGQAATEVRQ